jgi:hypothetical protein
MTTHIYDELPMLPTGEADRATVALAADHLRECTDCQQELVSALIAHASLSSAVRFAPELRASLSTAAGAEEAPGEPTELPDLSSIFEMAKQEARVPRHAVAAPRTRPTRARWLAAAAVGGILVGGGAVVAVQNVGGSPSARTVQLAAFDKGTVAASARVGSQEVRVDASALPAPGSGTNYEVWLTDTARKSLQPVGWVGADGRTILQIPSNLLDKFTNIEVSVQKIAEPYAFSGVSVLRGNYR